MPQTRTSDPVVLPLSLSEVKSHLRINGNQFDTQIAMWIRAITSKVEQRFKMQIVEAGWKFMLTEVRNAMDLPVSPVQDDTVVIRYLDEANEWQEVDANRYQVIRHRQISTIRFTPPLVDVPISKDRHYPFEITYKAGYKVESNFVKVPDDIKMYLLVLIGFLYASPEGLLDKKMDVAIDRHKGLIRDYIREYL